jgi:hypothetical protein
MCGTVLLILGSEMHPKRVDLKCSIQIGIRIETNAARRQCGLREPRLLLDMDLL